ncbi:hypothetical protein GCM10020331_090150 [Ectobacillus funiculus]
MKKSDTVCEDAIAEERFRYYVCFNHLFGLINAFGVNRLIDEKSFAYHDERRAETITGSIR